MTEGIGQPMTEGIDQPVKGVGQPMRGVKLANHETFTSANQHTGEDSQ